jgi:hypothetical protein
MAGIITANMLKQVVQGRADYIEIQATQQTRELQDNRRESFHTTICRVIIELHGTEASYRVMHNGHNRCD